MNKIYFFFVFTISFISCTTKIRYIGQSHPPTNDIEVFVSEGSIKKPFEYIGKGYLGGFVYHNNPEKIQKKAEKLGKAKGADAVLIMDYYVPDTGGTNIISAYRTDSVGRAVVTTGNTTISPTVASGYYILYIKYVP